MSVYALAASLGDSGLLPITVIYVCLKLFVVFSKLLKEVVGLSAIVFGSIEPKMLLAPFIWAGDASSVSKGLIVAARSEVCSF